MDTSFLEVVPEVFELLVLSVGSIALSLAGAYIERFAVATLQRGQLDIGLWAALIGIMAVYFSYLLFTDKFCPKFAKIRQTFNNS